MTKTIQFFFDFLSPYSYLAMTQLPHLAERTGATIEYRPINVIALMKKVSNRPTTVECPAKGQYAMADLARWANKYAVPFAPNPHFQTIDSDRLLLGAVAAERVKQAEDYTRAVFDGVWAKSAAFTDDQELEKVLKEAGVSQITQILEGRQRSEETQASYQEMAEAAGVFGVPGMVVGDELYFGNDRLEFMEEALAR
jgi:2-hydroxychromene-2-carboxylate isomerase